MGLALTGLAIQAWAEQFAARYWAFALPVFGLLGVVLSESSRRAAGEPLWPVVREGSAKSSRRRLVNISLTASDEAWLRQLGTDADLGISAVLSTCLQLIRKDASLGSRIAELLRRRPGSS